jgi:hypothetical protein
MARGRRRLVITEAFGYTLDVYRVFVLSLLHTGYRGDIKVLAPPNRTRPEAEAFLRAHGVELVTTRPSAWHNSDRFAAYAELCSAPEYDRCLVADFRDVFFQADPFHAAPDAAVAPDLVLPLEPRQIGPDPFNGPMIRACYGRDALRELYNDSVICSGVLMGSAHAFKALARALVPLAHRCPFDKMADQAALNRLVYSPRYRAKLADDGGRPLSLVLEPPGRSFTNTIGLWKGPKLAHDFEREHMRDGVVLNADGAPSPVVHQYDRTLLSPQRERGSRHLVWKGCYPGLSGLFTDVLAMVSCPPDVVRYSAVDKALVGHGRSSTHGRAPRRDARTA